jgi:hypothetical protein
VRKRKRQDSLHGRPMTADTSDQQQTSIIVDYVDHYQYLDATVDVTTEQNKHEYTDCMSACVAIAPHMQFCCFMERNQRHCRQFSFSLSRSSSIFNLSGDMGFSVFFGPRTSRPIHLQSLESPRARNNKGRKQSSLTEK